MKIFKPKSPDKSLGHNTGDNALAKLAHLNEIVVNLNQFAASANITAYAGGGQTLGTPLITGLNIVTTATTGDSVTLPCLVHLCQCSGGCSGPMAPTTIMNNGPGDLTVYPCLGEAINGQAINTPITVLEGTSLPILPVNPNVQSLPCPGDCLGCPTTWISLPGGDGGGGGGAFADFYALMPGDNAATIAIGAPVLFPQDGPTSATDITRLSSSTFNLAAIGTYEVNWQVSTDEAGQLALAIGGVALAPTVVGRATGTNQISGSRLITTSVINSVLSIINHLSPAALTITPTAGGTASVSASVTIKRLA